jgi:phage tail protein X
MSATVIPAATRFVELEDLSIDLICFEHAFKTLRDRNAAGRLDGYLEATLAANPGLSRQGAIVPYATIVHLPEFLVQTSDTQTVRLWDE